MHTTICCLCESEMSDTRSNTPNDSILLRSNHRNTPISAVVSGHQTPTNSARSYDTIVPASMSATFVVHTISTCRPFLLPLRPFNSPRTVRCQNAFEPMSGRRANKLPRLFRKQLVYRLGVGSLNRFTGKNNRTRIHIMLMQARSNAPAQ